ncbi:hypothetical protein GMD78_07260 [Ornithinibacillus sp. L9]|uniref:Uncharacterized protein n=1 Tax=Ornithinibacillus caprae TaxID=2678566 RepID=A0A6N8FF58_9BACI|nr:hypothetical protein [Ornithinibacillus caprae]MUK88190.1 hypothetical protein [Ornithinibacillus caprae]
MNYLDKTDFFIYQTTKVRVCNFTNKGIEVYTRSKDDCLGFVSYCNLLSETANLYKGKSLYVRYLGYKEPYLYFTEEGTLLFPELV